MCQIFLGIAPNDQMMIPLKSDKNHEFKQEFKKAFFLFKI